MSAAAILDRLRAAGLVLAVADHDAIAVRRSEALTDELRALIRVHKDELVALLTARRWRYRAVLPDGTVRTFDFVPDASLEEAREAIARAYPDAKVEALPNEDPPPPPESPQEAPSAPPPTPGIPLSELWAPRGNARCSQCRHHIPERARCEAGLYSGAPVRECELFEVSREADDER